MHWYRARAEQPEHLPLLAHIGKPGIAAKARPPLPAQSGTLYCYIVEKRITILERSQVQASSSSDPYNFLLEDNFEAANENSRAKASNQVERA